MLKYDESVTKANLKYKVETLTAYFEGILNIKAVGHVKLIYR